MSPVSSRKGYIPECALESHHKRSSLPLCAIVCNCQDNCSKRSVHQSSSCRAHSRFRLVQARPALHILFGNMQRIADTNALLCTYCGPHKPKNVTHMRLASVPAIARGNTASTAPTRRLSPRTTVARSVACQDDGTFLSTQAFSWGESITRSQTWTHKGTNKQRRAHTYTDTKTHT